MKNENRKSIVSPSKSVHDKQEAEYQFEEIDCHMSDMDEGESVANFSSNHNPPSSTVNNPERLNFMATGSNTNAHNQVAGQQNISLQPKKMDSREMLVNHLPIM